MLWVTCSMNADLLLNKGSIGVSEFKSVNSNPKRGRRRRKKRIPDLEDNDVSWNYLLLIKNTIMRKELICSN